MKLFVILFAFSLAQANILFDLTKQDYDNIKSSRNFTGKVALVTGSNSGIGEEIAKLFSVLGAQVVITGRNAETVRNVSEEVQQLSPKNLKPLQVVADLTKDQDVERLVSETIKAFGKIDILVNNAGSGVHTSIEDPKFMEMFDNVFNIDLRAPALVNHYAVPHLKKTNGTIIHISSSASMIPTSTQMPYNMAKSAMDMMTRCLALELGPNIRVNTINPGKAVPTMTYHCWNGFTTDTDFKVIGGHGDVDRSEIIKKIIQATPLKRRGEAVDIAKGVAFLASSDASFITGANLVIDGGLVFTAGGLMN